GAAVEQEVRGVEWVGGAVRTAAHGARRAVSSGGDLRQRLVVNVGIHLGELEQVFPVVAAPGVVVRGRRQPKITLMPVSFCCQIRGDRKSTRLNSSHT